MQFSDRSAMHYAGWNVSADTSIASFRQPGGAAMQIEFPDHRPMFNYEELTIEFAVVVNGRPIDCAVSAEALESHFHAHSARADDLLHAFEHGRSRIHALTREYLAMGLPGPVLLRSGHFRWAQSQSARR